jgi:hypothetical protein
MKELAYPKARMAIGNYSRPTPAPLHRRGIEQSSHWGGCITPLHRKEIELLSRFGGIMQHSPLWEGGEGLISLHAVWPSGVGVGLISNMLRRLTGMLFHPRLNSNSEVGISAGGDADTQSYSSEPLTTPGRRRGRLPQKVVVRASGLHKYSTALGEWKLSAKSANSGNSTNVNFGIRVKTLQEI